MPIVKCHANKRALADTVSYIMNPLKVIARGNQGFMTADPTEMVNQMQETLRLHGKQKGRHPRPLGRSSYFFAMVCHLLKIRFP